MERRKERIKMEFQSWLSHVEQTFLSEDDNYQILAHAINIS